MMRNNGVVKNNENSLQQKSEHKLLAGKEKVSPKMIFQIGHIQIKYVHLINYRETIQLQQVYLSGIMFTKLVAAGLGLSSFLMLQKQSPECCGIVGIVSKNAITEEQAKADPKKRITLQKFLCDGIELLKNRGYDSAGIFRAGRNLQEGILIKYAGEESNINCIDRLVDEVLSETGIATIGIAHTRWATCGGIVTRNAHPHFDETRRVFVVHNGIISNHAQIKRIHLNDVKFTSECDTEVLAQFLAKQVNQGKTMLEALKLFGTILGKASQLGLVVVDKQEPEKIYTYSDGSPILIGFSPQQDQIFVVSEKLAFQSYANCYFPTNDKQVFELGVNEISKLKEHFKDRLIYINDPPEVLKRPPEPYKTFYNYEVRQQASIQFHPDFSRVKNTIKFGSYLSMLACGSSFYAAHASEPFFKLLKCFRKFYIVDPAELDQHDITDDETVVVISQSGQTKDLIKIIDDLKHKQNVNTIGIINVEGSTIARKVDFPIYIKVGRETCVAATKSFFHQVLNLVQFTTEVAEQKKSAPIQIIQSIRSQLKIVPSFVQQIINDNQMKCQQLAQILKEKTSIFLLGKRETMAIAKEAALKIKQLNYIHAQALGASEMKHGPIALIDSTPGKKRQTVVFLFILENDTYPYLMNALDQVHTRNAYSVIITDCLHLIEESFQLQKTKYFAWKEKLESDFLKDCQQLRNDEEKLKKCKEKFEKELKERVEPTQKYQFALTVPHLKYMSHLLSIIPIQIFVEKMAVLKDINIDFPRNLAKSVTV